MLSTDPITFAFQRGLGPWLTPLRGKIPVLDAWQSLPAATEAQVREWQREGYNLGLRTGVKSGITAIDDDQARHDIAPEDRYVPPPTGLVFATPTGGWHHLYQSPDPCPGNSANKLAPYVDVRGEGGQIVFPGSIHPVVEKPYRIEKDGNALELPAAALEVLMPPKRVKIDSEKPAEPAPRGNGYADTAMVQEVGRVRTAGEGGRNDQLFKSSASLFELVAGGALSESVVKAELEAAARIAGLEEKEIQQTIASGQRAGMKQPRTVPERPRSATGIHKTPPATTPGVLVPGSHVVPGGEYIEQGTNAFATQALAALPPGTLYRRAETVGEIHVDRFRAVMPHRMRSVIDEHVRLTAGKTGKEDEEPTLVFRACTSDNAQIALAYAETRGTMRDLVHLATHPVCTGPEFTVSSAGWNEDSGVYVTDREPVTPLDLPTARAVLEDLVVDFPFATPADRANYFGLLLTPILRPSLNEPVPMHLLGSPIERSGKTKLAETVLGCAVLGHPTPAMQLGTTEEEREKRITALLLGGHSVVHLDNLQEFVNSPALASLLTSTVFQGRELNHSRILSIPNGLTVVASGNNVHATGEIAKRVVPITLQPPLEAPESRQDYRHPHLRTYVEGERPRVLAALLGLVGAWKEAGQPMGGVGFGGFERWVAVLGGIMRVAGYPEWLTNLHEWRGGADEFNEELRELVKAWFDRSAHEWVPTAELFKLSEDLELFTRISSSKLERGRQTAFGIKVINAIDKRVVLGHSIEVTGHGKRRRARLAAQPLDDTPNLEQEVGR